MSGFGGSIKLTGEAAYRQALQGIAADLKKVAAEQKLTAATYDKSDTSLSALSKRADELKNKLAAQQEKVKTLTAALKDYQSQQEKNKSTIANLQTQLEKEKATLEQIGKQYGTASKEYQAQAKVVNELEQQLKELNTQYEKNETTVKKTQAALTSAEADVKKTGTAMEKLARQAEEAGEGADKLGLAVDDSGKKANSAAEGGYTVLKNVLANLVTQVINRAIDGIKQLGTAVFQTGVDFDAGMSRVEAISGATGESLEQLAEKAKEMGRTTKYSATDATTAMYYMAMAGWKAEDMLQGLGPVLDLAAASGEDLSRVSDIVTDALTAMGYTAQESGRFADVLAASASNANVTVDTMGATFKYVGAVAGSLGYNMEDVAESISLLGNSGVKAEMAGTALRSVMTRLATDTGKATQAANELGVEITNQDGSMREWGTVVDELRAAFNGLTDEQKTQYAKTIAGTEAMNGFLILMNSTEQDINKVRTAIRNSTGAAKEMADTMLNNVGGKLTLLKRQIESGFLKVWEKIEPIVSKTIDSIARELKKVDWNKFGEAAGQALEKVANGFKWLLEHKDLVINALKMMVAAFAVKKVWEFTTGISDAVSALKNMAGVTGGVTTLVKNLTTAQGLSTVATGAGTAAVKLFNAAWAANPIGVVVAGLGLLVGGIIAVTSALGDQNSKMSETDRHLQDSKKLLEENTASWEELSNAQQENVNKGMTEMKHYQNLADELNSIVDANGKVKDGYEERANFIATTLSEALGIEIHLQDGVIQGYENIKQSIYDTIAAKKAKIQLDAQEALYTEALQKQGEVISTITQLEKDRDQAAATTSQHYSEYLQKLTEGNEYEAEIARTKWETSKKTVENLDADLAKQTELYGMYAYNIAQYEDNMVKFSEGKYNEMQNIRWEDAQSYESAEEYKKATAMKAYEDTQTELDLLNKLYKETGDERLKNLITETETSLETQRKGLKQFNINADTELKKNIRIWDDSLGETLSTITGADIDFKDAGDGNVQMYIDGVATGEAKSKKEMKTLVENTIAEVDKLKPSADTAGQNLIAGVNNGIQNQNQQSGAFRSIWSFGSSLLANLKASLQEQSPSKATKQMGMYLLQGLGLGIKKEQDTVLDQVEGFGDNVLNTLNTSLAEGVSTNALQALQTAIPSEFNATIGTNTSRMAEAAQIADKSLVGYFKQALSEMKIEMDDIAMGKFVDNTVTKLVYN